MENEKEKLVLELVKQIEIIKNEIYTDISLKKYNESQINNSDMNNSTVEIKHIPLY